jgi:pyridoxamine 5'-phosphate oxidase
MTAEFAGLRKLLRSQRVFPDEMPGFDPQAAPDDPVTLFLRWLEAAIQAGVPTPHAMTLTTADERGQPSSRVLICKDVDTEGHWYFGWTLYALTADEVEFWQGSAAWARYPPASRAAGDRRSATVATTGATMAAGTSCATATKPAMAVPPRR